MVDKHFLTSSLLDRGKGFFRQVPKYDGRYGFALWRSRFTKYQTFEKEIVLVNTDSTASAESEPEVAEQASQSQSDVIIQTRNLSKIYRDFWGRKKVNALKSLDIEVRPVSYTHLTLPTS